MDGETNSVAPTVATSVAIAALGKLAGAPVEVNDETPPPEAAVVHPGGNAGALTASKVSVKEGQFSVASSAPISA
jgi:hypothetical protein